MKDPLSHPVTAFSGGALLFAGPLVEVALAIKNANEKTPTQSMQAILAFDDNTGRVIDLDLRGSTAEIIERLMQRASETPLKNIPPESSAASAAPTSSSSSSASTSSSPTLAAEARGRGRPKLGVIAREVTLLPRHWEWLATQSGGASVTLRRLVEEARRDDGGRRQWRDAQEAAYRFMSAIAGDLPGFEEACRALFANNSDQFRQHIAQWPEDIRSYAIRLAFGIVP
jgi:hypothetical protein